MSEKEWLEILLAVHGLRSPFWEGWENSVIGDRGPMWDQKR